MVRLFYFKGSDWIEINHLLQKILVSETLGEELDALTFQYDSLEKHSIGIETPVCLEIDNISLFYIVSVINDPLIIVKHPKVVYRHTIVALEPTKYLEKITLSNQTFTNTNDTLIEQIEKLLINTEVLRSNEMPRFRMSDSLKTFLLGVPGEDFIMTTPTLREALDMMLSVINSRARVVKIENFNDIEIDYEDLNSTTEIVNAFQKLISEGKNQDIEYYSGSIETYAQNALSSEEYLVTQDFNVFKSRDGGVLTKDNAMILTEFAVDYIKNFIVKCKCNNQYGRYNEKGVWETLTSKTIWMEVNLSNYLIDQELYDQLDEATLFNKFNFDKSVAIPYNRGSTEIQVLKTTRRIFFNPMNIESAIKRELSSYGNDTNRYILDAYFDWKNVIYALVYIPFRDVHLRIDKPNSLSKTTMFDSQSDKAIDVVRYGANLEGKIKRLGNQVLVNDTIIKSYSYLRKLGEAISDNFVLINRSYIVYNKCIQVKYTFSKDYNNINEKIGINRERRLYSIPLDYVDRDLLLKKYICFGTTIPDTSKKVPGMFLQGFVNILIGGSSIPEEVFREDQYNGFMYANANWLGERITKAIVTTSPDKYEPNPRFGPYELTTASYATNKSLVFQFKFQDSYSVNNSLGKNVIGGKKLVLNPYVDDNGEYNKLYFGLSTFDVGYDEEVNASIELERARKLPLRDDMVFPLYYQDDYNQVINNRLPIFISESIKTRHDRYSRDSLTYQVDLVSLDDVVIIGKALAKYNRLVRIGFKQVKLYGSIKNYHDGDFLADLTSVLGTVSLVRETKYYKISLNFTRPLEINEVSWVLADENKEIYIASNDPNVKEIYLHMVDKLI